MYKNKFHLKIKKGIILIGMAGAGKSTVGKILAQKLKFKFIDGDKFIEKQKKIKLQDIIDLKGEKYFLKIEENLLMRLAPLNKKIISPGGSVIYSKRLMIFFKRNAFVVWLDVPFSIIHKRIAGQSDRGVIFNKKKTLKEVFYERKNLYRKYSDIKINCKKRTSSIIAKIILNSVFTHSKSLTF